MTLVWTLSRENGQVERTQRYTLGNLDAGFEFVYNFLVNIDDNLRFTSLVYSIGVVVLLTFMPWKLYSFK